MKKFVTAGTLVGVLALGTAAFAQSAPATQPKQPATKQTPPPKAAAGAEKSDQAATEKPAAPRRRARPAAGENASNTHTAPKEQPRTTDEPSAPGAMALGSVRLPGGVKANGEAIPAGMYQVRLTADEAKPDAKGSTEKLERWVEFVKGGKVAGREVVSIVPATEAKLVQKDTPPASGGSKVETLKGGDYVRVWINKAGNYYLVHLVKG